jgi:hypothetical protein
MKDVILSGHIKLKGHDDKLLMCLSYHRYMVAINDTDKLQGCQIVSSTFEQNFDLGVRILLIERALRDLITNAKKANDAFIVVVTNTEEHIAFTNMGFDDKGENKTTKLLTLTLRSQMLRLKK